MRQIEFTIDDRCPSVHGHRVGDRLREWRAAISDRLVEQGMGSSVSIPEHHIRKVVAEYLNGPCRMEAKFSLRATKNVADLDRMVSFIAGCFRTELTEAAAEIEAGLGTRPWFYYDAFAYPGNMDLVEVEAHRYDGQSENRTSVRITRLGLDSP